jgi:hypothetical protein
MRGSRSFVALSIVAAAACGPSRDPRLPRPGDPAALAKATRRALEIEATRPPNEALDAWLGVLADAREVVGTPLAREAALSAIDAIVGREVFGLEALGHDVGLGARVEGGPTKAIVALDATLAGPGGRDPMIRAYAADARLRFALAAGDAPAVAEARKLSGCATEATVVGPFAGPVLVQLADRGPVDGGEIAPSYPPATPLALAPSVSKSGGRGCEIDPTGGAKATGLRYVVVDVDVPSPQTIAVALDTAVPARLLVAGKSAIVAPYGELMRRTTRVGRIQVGAAGPVRLVVKLGAWTNDPIGLYAVAEDGTPLSSRAANGPAPTTPVVAVAPEARAALPALGANPGANDARVTWALGTFSAGDVRIAEGVIAEIARGTKVDPAAALVYARTLAYARDIPLHRRLERQRAAFDAVLAEWPNSWEAIVGRAQIVALQRRGGAGEVEAIADLRARRDDKRAPASSRSADPYVDPLVDVFLALIGDGIYGMREEGLARAIPRVGKTIFAHRFARVTAKETTDATIARDCDPKRPDLGRFDCASARSGAGDHAGVLAEIARLRALHQIPKLGVEWEISSTLKTAGVAKAKALWDAADVTDRSARLASNLAPPGAAGVEWLRRELRLIDADPRPVLELVNARRARGEAGIAPHPSHAFAEKARTLVAADRKKPARPDAGTYVVAREERYELLDDGYLHATTWDLRRLAGTQDVDANASAQVANTTSGNGWMGRAIHRIHKADGTIVEPDRIAAAQAGAELSQIEPGDYVELVAEGWFSARADGTFDLDTPDLLPSRTAVGEATISLVTPTKVPLELWSHAALGKPTATESTGRRTLVWTVRNQDVRRSERGQAPIDREVAVRLGTWSWDRLGREARENVLADEERLPEVSAWVAEATGGDRAPTLDLLARLSRASKKAIPRVGLLPLGLSGLSSPQTYTARSVLLDAQGSRVALVRRALDELGVRNEIVWAESGPYSADPKMVARPWRFSSPPRALLVAWVGDKPGDPPKPVWLDVDVDGAPPPPGRTSPELRGRTAITTSGAIVPVPANANEEPDLATIDLTVDASGTGRGTFTLLLRGRDAQDLSAIMEEAAGEERDNALRQYVLAWMPSADVHELKASAETWQVLINARIDVPGLLVPEGSRFSIAGTPPLHSGARAGTLGGTYAAQAKRTTALTIRDAVFYGIHRVIRLPQGTAIRAPLPSLDAKDEGTSLTASRRVKVDGSTIIEDFAFSLPTGVVPATAFDGFTAVARSVDDGFQAVLRVQPPAGAIQPAASAGEKK